MQRRLSAIAVAFALTSAGLVLAGSPAQAACGCEEYWAPVCGVKGGQQKTYTNAQCAKCAGATVVHDGNCKRS
jgi:hypothetical protein